MLVSKILGGPWPPWPPRRRRPCIDIPFSCDIVTYIKVLTRHCVRLNPKNDYFKGRNFRGKKNREIFTFRGNKLSRMTSYEKFRGNKLSG